METIQTDTELDNQSPVGVGQVSPLGRDLYSILPNWLADGFGVRGPQIQRRSEVAPPREQMFGNFVDNPTSRPPLIIPPACQPSTPNPSGTWVWGSIDGVCQWIDTTTCS